MIAALISSIVCRPAIRERLIEIAMRDPDTHITSHDGSDVYMYRYWLFNRIDRKTRKRRYPFIPFSLRIHRIMREDRDRHCHDHPFNARTWILKGGYEEVRVVPHMLYGDNDHSLVEHRRLVGDSTTLGYHRYHKITKLYGGEAITLFMFGRYKGGWGFLVDGRKMLRAEYDRRFKPQANG